MAKIALTVCKTDKVCAYGGVDQSLRTKGTWVFGGNDSHSDWRCEL